MTDTKDRVGDEPLSGASWDANAENPQRPDAPSRRSLGARWNGAGVDFAIFSKHASRVDVALYAESGRETGREVLRKIDRDVWHTFVPGPRATIGTTYAYHVSGPWAPHLGHRFDGARALLDPYARCVSGSPPRSRVIDGRFDWGRDRPPRTSWRETVIYELHVKGYTHRHPAVPEVLRGKFLGLTVAAVIAHLQALGVTAVELLPIHSFANEPFLTLRGLRNYWGYNSIAWFSPAAEYAVDDPVLEFKSMVKALHSAGLEVILDVVFNHTAEGDDTGPLLSLKGIDNSEYYRLMADKSHYENLTGCGNTVACEHAQVQALIIDCLKYWVDEMHVDGFRFDLATVLAREAHGFNPRSAFFDALRADRSFDHIKLIAEPWDVGIGGYQLGSFPPGWAEWNDRYRDTVRSFWRGDSGKVGDFAERIAGSSDIFRHSGRTPTASINFVTSHDGFTLNDLVSYNERHNEANLEHNTDGTANNLSWNCGSEGVPVEESVAALRRRQMRNFLATLFLSQGVPMLTAGDEFARTQAGNNNAYCQDNEISWLDWRLAEANRDLIDFVRLLTAVRRRRPELRRETFLRGTVAKTGIKDVTWLRAGGGEMSVSDWHEAQIKTLGALFGGDEPATRLLLLANAGTEAQSFYLPAMVYPATTLGARVWRCLFDTAHEAGASTQLEPRAPSYLLSAHSLALLEC